MRRNICALLTTIILMRGSFSGFADDFSNMFSGPNVFWGSETNGLQLGLEIDPISSSNNSPILCIPILKSSRTNHLWLYLPPMKSRFQLTLLDENKNTVTKTEKAEQSGAPLTQPFRLTTDINIRAGYSGLPPLYSNEPESLDLYRVNLRDYFVLTNTGKYNLKFIMTVIWFPPKWKGDYKSPNVPMVALPPVKAQIEIKGP